MARLFKPLFAWLQLLWFLITLVLRLEQRITWDWFLVFLPIFLLDVTLLGTLVTRLAFDLLYMNTRLRSSMKKRRQVLYLFYLSAKVAFQILLCLRLDAFVDIALYWVLTPLYCMLPVLIIDASVALYVMA